MIDTESIRYKKLFFLFTTKLQEIKAFEQFFSQEMIFSEPSFSNSDPSIFIEQVLTHFEKTIDIKTNWNEKKENDKYLPLFSYLPQWFEIQVSNVKQMKKKDDNLKMEEVFSPIFNTFGFLLQKFHVILNKSVGNENLLQKLITFGISNIEEGSIISYLPLGSIINLLCQQKNVDSYFRGLTKKIFKELYEKIVNTDILLAFKPSEPKKIAIWTEKVNLIKFFVDNIPGSSQDTLIYITQIFQTRYFSLGENTCNLISTTLDEIGKKRGYNFDAPKINTPSIKIEKVDPKKQTSFPAKNPLQNNTSPLNKFVRQNNTSPLKKFAPETPMKLLILPLDNSVNKACKFLSKQFCSSFEFLIKPEGSLRSELFKEDTFNGETQQALSHLVLYFDLFVQLNDKIDFYNIFSSQHNIQNEKKQHLEYMNHKSRLKSVFSHLEVSNIEPHKQKKPKILLEEEKDFFVEKNLFHNFFCHLNSSGNFSVISNSLYFFTKLMEKTFENVKIYERVFKSILNFSFLPPNYYNFADIKYSVYTIYNNIIKKVIENRSAFGNEFLQFFFQHTINQSIVDSFVIFQSLSTSSNLNLKSQVLCAVHICKYLTKCNSFVKGETELDFPFEQYKTILSVFENLELPNNLNTNMRDYILKIYKNIFSTTK